MGWESGGVRPNGLVVVEVFGREFRAPAIRQLFKMVKKHLTWDDNLLPVNWEDEVWLALQVKYPKWIRYVPAQGASRGISIASILAFVNFARKRFLDKALVAPEVARERASTCRGCPLKEDILGCSTCKLALSSVLPNPPEALDVPQGCGVCGCYLPLKVWVPQDQLSQLNVTIWGKPTKFDFPEWCWAKERE